MKIKNVLLLIVALSLLLCACNDTTITTEPESAPAPSASEEYTPDLTLARQVFDRLQANEGGVFATDQCYSLSDHQAGPGVFAGWSDCFAYDNTGDPVFPSRAQAEQIVNGLLINEVYDLIGCPHYNTGIYLKGGHFKKYDMYTMYVLDDGNVLLLGYSSLILENYTKDELVLRVGEDREISSILWDWRVLTSIQLLSIEELAEMEMGKWSSKEYKTSEEDSPKKITMESAEQAAYQSNNGLWSGQPWTYGQFKEFLGSGGEYCSGYYEGDVYKFTWRVDDPGGYTTLEVSFEPTQGAFDDMVATTKAYMETAFGNFD